MEQRRDVQIDLLKSLAIVLVIVVHTCFYWDPVGSGQWVQSLLLGSLARPAVPLFLMCSGALLLRPEKPLPLKRLLLHNVLRLAAAMLFWAMAYKLWWLIQSGFSAAGLWESVKEVLLFRQEFHLYYIHIMLLVYLLLPVVRIFVKAASERQLWYALGFWWLFGILYPTLLPFWPFSLLTGFPLQWKLNMTYAAAGYGLLGYTLRRHPLPRGVSAALFAGGFAFVFGGTLLFSLRRGALYEDFFEGMSVGVCCMAAGIFCLAARARPSERLCSVLSWGSRASFCIYLVHVFFLYLFQGWGYRELALPRLLLIPLVGAAICLLSAGVYWLLSKIPVVNRWLI